MTFSEIERYITRIASVQDFDTAYTIHESLMHAFITDIANGGARGAEWLIEEQAQMILAARP